MLSLHVQRKLMEAPNKKEKMLMELATGQHWHQPVLGGYQLLNIPGWYGYHILGLISLRPQKKNCEGK